MTINGQQFGQLAVSLIEQLEERYASDETSRISEIMVILLVDHDGPTKSTAHIHCTDPRWFIQLGVLAAAKMAIEMTTND